MQNNGLLGLFLNGFGLFFTYFGAPGRYYKGYLGSSLGFWIPVGPRYGPLPSLKGSELPLFEGDVSWCYDGFSGFRIRGHTRGA